MKLLEKNYWHVGFLFAVSLTLTGCISSPVTPSAAVNVPSKYISAPSIAVGEKPSLVTFTRDTGGNIFARGGRLIVYLDSKPILRIGQGETAMLQVPPGQHTFGCEIDAKIKSLNQIHNIAVTLRPNQRYHIRALSNQDGFRLQETSKQGDAR